MLLGWPWLLLFVVVRPSLSVLGWATAWLWLSWLLGLAIQGLSRSVNLMLARSLYPLGVVAVVALGLQLLVFPAEVLFLFPTTWYPWVQLAAVVAVAVGVVALVGVVRDTLLPPRPPRTLADALMAAAEPGTGAAGRPGAWGRRLRRELAATLPHGVPLVDRVRVAVAHRAAVLLRYAATAAVVLVFGVVALVWVRGAFAEGWVALLVALALAAETRLHRWRREGLLDGFAEPDPWAGRGRYDAWWGLSAGLALVVTLRTTAAMGGLRDDPLWWYGAAVVLAAVAAVVPFRWANTHQGEIFAAWLERHPERVAELESLRASWPEDSDAPFGELPAQAARRPTDRR
ncbi:hypothetical protein PCC79_01990 [Propioniciclava soli]|uniref:ABC transporter permease n=1 Tax=Propioniciclava soli TaxID=2775081 RepID=A0ABZ3C8C5_9ACTN